MPTFSTLINLFLTFFKVGAVSFGGGYGMLSLLRETVVSANWLTDSEFLNFVAVSESTPGPVAINMATFIGSSQAGVLGSMFATFGVVMPSFIIILIIVALVNNLIKYAGVQGFLRGVRPCAIGLIVATAITMFLSTIVGFVNFETTLSVDYKGIIILAIIALIGYIYKRIKGKKISPILLIVISAGLGILAYSPLIFK
ncbi:MAG: chromate transporter [Clostridia bacterium]|nr:chromate transporter [Clostridia bacterium]